MAFLNVCFYLLASFALLDYLGKLFYERLSEWQEARQLVGGHPEMRGVDLERDDLIISRQIKPSVRQFSAMTKRVPMTLFSVTSSFLMKMVFDPMQKGARECAPLPPKGELLVDLKSCHLAGDPDCSSLGLGAGHRVMKRPRWRCSYRFSSASTSRHVICSVSTCHWRSLVCFT